MSICFYDKQKIRHKYMDKVRIGEYSKSMNKIIYNENEYSLNKFATNHLTKHSNRKTCNAWADCECLVDGKWISTFNL